eukprot:Nitzschia sp. Nitz4//scaffold72_size95085//69073//70162//NITZ4_004766-RA/size95085-snap-gene-0.117-mRNA-1//1//CDS//3329557393//7491//frame0
MLLLQHTITVTAMDQDQHGPQRQGQEPRPDPSCSSFRITNYPNNRSNTQLSCNIAAKSSRWNQSAQFPWKIHRMLEDAELDGFVHIVSWMPDNKAFRVHDNGLFVELVLPRYFRQTQYKSFQRQLNLWGFERANRGLNHGGYSHKCFVRGQTDLCKNMKRQKIKGDRRQQANKMAFSTPTVNKSMFLMKQRSLPSTRPRMVSPASPCHVTQGSAMEEQAAAIVQLPPLPSTRTKPFRGLFDEETLASVLLMGPDSGAVPLACSSSTPPPANDVATQMQSNTIVPENHLPKTAHDPLEVMNRAETFEGMTFFAVVGNGYCGS